MIAEINEFFFSFRRNVASEQQLEQAFCDVNIVHSMYSIVIYYAVYSLWQKCYLEIKYNQSCFFPLID